LSYAHVIVNPIAGAGKTAKKWPQIMDLLKSIGLHIEHDLTEAPGYARELAESAAKKGYELVVSVEAGTAWPPSRTAARALSILIWQKPRI